MNGKTFATYASFIVPVIMATMTLIAHGVGAKEATAVIGSLAGVSFGWAGRVIASYFGSKDDGQ